MPNQGPNYAGAGANDGGANWSNPTNAVGAPDGAYAHDTPPGTPNYLALTQFGFSVSQPPVGLIVELFGHASNPTTSLFTTFTLDGSTQYGTAVSQTLPYPADIWTAPLGSTTSLSFWAIASLSAAQANASTFGILLEGDSTGTSSIDAVRVTVYYEDGPELYPLSIEQRPKAARRAARSAYDLIDRPITLLPAGDEAPDIERRVHIWNP